MHYLTVQDILWINLQVGKKVNKFNYAKLEEATFYQYSYGESQDVSAQATRFLKGFLKLKPLDELNEATGIIGAIAFLQINGYSCDLKDTDGGAWVKSCAVGGNDLASLVKRADHEIHGHKPDVRATIESVLRSYSQTVGELVAAGTAA